MACRVALLGLAIWIAGCGGSRPPAELAGLWSAGSAACQAGVGIRFGERAIEAVYENQRETLFDKPRYRVIQGKPFRVRIEYELPRPAGGARSIGAHGVVILAGGAEGGLSPVTHNLVDARTGAVRLRVDQDPAIALLTLVSCEPGSSGQRLRGRSET